MTGKIILANGASSSGKSALCAALKARLDEPFWHYSIDHIRHASVLPARRIERGDFSWPEMRQAFFEGFHRCLPALAGAGNNLLVEHIVVHALVRRFGAYDIEDDVMKPLEDNGDFVLAAWQARAHPTAFEQTLEAERKVVQNTL